MGDSAAQPWQLQGLSTDTVTDPTPLLDSFKRGEVARDARLLAAQEPLRLGRTSNSRFLCC